MKRKLLIPLLVLFFAGIFVFIHPPSHSLIDQEEQAMDEDNAEVRAIVRDIKENGPRELRQLPLSIIESSARSFVVGRRTGAISTAQMARLGGARGATELTLMGELKASGQ